MNKFGIFNLLGSLLSKNPNANQQNVDNSSSQKNDFLSSISSLFSSSSKNNSPIAEKKKEEKATFSAPPPLQSKMLYTMTSHDEFIKRVKDNQNKTKTRL